MPSGTAREVKRQSVLIAILPFSRFSSVCYFCAVRLLRIEGLLSGVFSHPPGLGRGLKCVSPQNFDTFVTNFYFIHKKKKIRLPPLLISDANNPKTTANSNAMQYARAFPSSRRQHTVAAGNNSPRRTVGLKPQYIGFLRIYRQT